MFNASASDGNMCFFLSTETKKKRESKMVKYRDEARKRVGLGDRSAAAPAFKAWLSPC